MRAAWERLPSTDVDQTLSRYSQRSILPPGALLGRCVFARDGDQLDLGQCHELEPKVLPAVPGVDMIARKQEFDYLPAPSLPEAEGGEAAANLHVAANCDRSVSGNRHHGVMRKKLAGWVQKQGRHDGGNHPGLM